MPRAIWGTPQPASATDYADEEPRGILGFLGGGQDIGAEVGDRLGIVSQILMNLGSGRGGTGIAEATAAANERSAARREDNRNKAMVNRMADKLEPSNPEMAMMMRANTKFGMQMLGKQLEDEWTSKSDMAKLNKQYELAGANELALQAQKAKDKQRDITTRLASMGLNVDYGDTPASNAPVPTVADAGAVPSPAGSMGSGGGGSTPVVPNQPAPAPTGGGMDYTVGLTDNPQLRAVQLQQRKLYNDPDMPIEDVLTLIDSGFTDTSEGANLVRKNVNTRKEKRARVQGLQDKAAAADATFQAAQGLPGINMNAPGEDLMRGVGIDPKQRPDLNPAQTAERLRTAVQDPEQYNSLLSNLAKPAAAGGTITLADGTVIQTGASKPDTAEQNRQESLALRAQISIPILDDPSSKAALTTGWEMYKDAALPRWLTNSMALLSPEYKLATVAGANYLSAILRQESLSAIKPEEFDMYGPFLLPQKGDDDALLAFKSELRKRTYQGLLRNMSPAAQLDYATTATRQRKEALAKGEAPPPLPDINQWPTGTGTEGARPAPTGTQPAPAPSPIDDLLKKYPPKPAAGP